jgi:60 kDa SS-A/Ro ribonucleoprotein
MPDPLRSVSTRVTPQTEQADPRQVKNNAGGYSFTQPEHARLHRFLTLGTDGGTYYASEQKLTRDNAEVVISWARERTSELVAKVVEVSDAGRAPRNNPALFALAAAAGLGDDEGRKLALKNLQRVARTGTHLFLFAGYVQQFRGWGRGLQRAVGAWYTAKPASDLAYQVLKYRQREGWTHRDLLRLARPGGAGSNRDMLRLTPEGHPRTHQQLFDFICGREADLADLPLVQAFVDAQAATTAKDWVRIIDANPGLSWEMLPDAALNEPSVWETLINAGMPLTALMRQLPRLTRLGVVGPANRVLTGTVCGQLTDSARLKKARVHPVSALVAQRTYAQGHGKNSTWTPVPAVTDALDAAFYAAYGAVEPANKRTLVGVDVSGSMMYSASGLPLSCREISAALALVIASTEPDHVIMAFCDRFVPLNISPRQRLDDAIRAVSNLPFGGTDCSLPMTWALRSKTLVDTFMVITDNETWYGDVHPHQALVNYRQRYSIPARQVVAGMTATNFTIADPDDPATMDVAGFDSAVPQLLADFSRGDV